jgi:hypothetical protein
MYVALFSIKQVTQSFLPHVHVVPEVVPTQIPTLSQA